MTKASIKKINPIIYFLIIFIRIALSVPEYALGIYAGTRRIDFSFKSFVTLVSIVLFSLALSLAIKKLSSSGNEFSAFPLLLIFLDPAFFYAFYNSAAMIVLALEICVIFLITHEKSTVKTTLAMAVFSVVSTLIMPASLFSYVPLMLLVYVLYSFRSGEKGNAKLIFTCVLVLLLSVAASMINEQILPYLNSVDPFYFSNPFYSAAFITTMPAWEFAVMYAPFLIIGFVFLYKYMQIKDCSKILKACVTVLILLVYSVMLVGVFAFNHLASFTMVNLIMPLSIIALYIKDSGSAERAAGYIMNFFKNKAGISIILLIIWMFFAVCFIKSVTYSSLWSIIFTNTGYLLY